MEIRLNQNDDLISFHYNYWNEFYNLYISKFFHLISNLQLLLINYELKFWI